MLDVNVKILSELKNFISLVLTERALLRRFSVNENAFTRTRKLPFDKLVLLIGRLCKKTLSVELEQFFADMGISSLSCSVSAFSQQRMKLEPVFFYYWNQLLCNSFYYYAAHRVKRWKGYRLIATDGSGVSLVNNTALHQYFGGQRNQKTFFAQAKTLYRYDVLNELLLSAQISPYRIGELTMAYQSVTLIEPDMLQLYDRNFCNYKMIALHLFEETERKFVIRAKETLKIVQDFVQSGQTSAIVEMAPTPSAIEGLRKCGYIISKNTLLKVRLIRVELAGCTEVLLTNLWEQEGHDAATFKELYALRWAIESNIAVQKNIVQLESFSGLTPTAVMQDFYATVMITNLHAVLLKEAQCWVEQCCVHRKYPMKINKNKSFGKLKAAIVQLFICQNINTLLKKLKDDFVKQLIPVRKGRSFPRIRKNIQSRSKYKTFTNFKPAY